MPRNRRRPRLPALPPGPSIPDDAFEAILQQAVIRPAGRQFRGEPARQVEILRYLRQAVGRPVPFVEIHDHLRRAGVVRSERVDDTARRKAVGQAVDAINTKLGTFFFQVRDIRLLEEMFRIDVRLDDTGQPAYTLQDFFEVRKLSGVRFYATTDEPAGGITRELYELVTDVRPRRLDMMAPSLESFFGNAEFRGMLTRNLQEPTGPESKGPGREPQVRVLLLDPDSPTAEAIERLEHEEAPLLGSLRERIRSTLAHVVDIIAALPKEARERFTVRVASDAPLWRFRMIFLPDVLHLRLSVPDSAGQTLIKLGVSSALYSSLHDVFEQQWQAAGEGHK